MTAFSRIPVEQIQDQEQWRQCHAHLSNAVTAAEGVRDGQRMIGEALCAALDTVGGGAPEYAAFGDMRADADWWADTATPTELEIYAGAALRRIQRTTFASRARKRLFNMLWQSFSSDERTAFLAAARKREG